MAYVGQTLGGFCIALEEISELRHTGLCYILGNRLASHDSPMHSVTQEQMGGCTRGYLLVYEDNQESLSI